MVRRNSYREILVEAIRSKPGWQSAAEVPFDQTDLRAAATRLAREVRNFPDVTYSLRSRQSLPPELTQIGFKSIEMRGSGKFALTRNADELELPSDIPIRKIDTTSIPGPVRELVRSDEQGVLSVVQYLDLIGIFLGTKALRLQGHLRMTGGVDAQVEIDEVYVASLENQETWAIVLIEAKSQKERIGLSQIRSLVNVARAEFSGREVIPIALKVEREGVLLLVRFSYSLAPEGHVHNLVIADLARYSIDPAPLSWKS